MGARTDTASPNRTGNNQGDCLTDRGWTEELITERADAQNFEQRPDKRAHHSEHRSRVAGAKRQHLVLPFGKGADSAEFCEIEAREIALDDAAWSTKDGFWS